MSSRGLISLEGNCVHVDGRMNLHALHWVIAKLNEARQAGYGNFILDFTECEYAYPDGLVPLAAFVDNWRSKGLEFDLVLPESDPAARLLENCNFAHYVRPDIYKFNQILLPKHAAIRKFSTVGEQVNTVRDFINIALNNTKMPRDVLQGMEWSLNEIIDNVLIHAQANCGGFAQASALDDHVAFTVADCGRGILHSLREAYPALTRDIDAIGEAVKAGVTRNPEIGQGNGLAGSLRIATESGGSLIVSSGQGSLTAFNNGHSSESLGKRFWQSQSFPGTTVSIQIKKNATFKVSLALGFTNMIGGVLDVIESDYETQDGCAFVVQMRKETPGFGSRETGKQIRTKICNLLEADRTKYLILDWAGVPLISSSFADEAVGKLFIELGPIEFSSRIRNIGLVGLVRQLIDKAILQRAAQRISALAFESATTASKMGVIEEPSDEQINGE